MLTPRETEILCLLVNGLTNSQIGAQLGITVHTVEMHISRIIAKLGYQSRVEVAVWAAVNRIVSVEKYLMKG